MVIKSSDHSIHYCLKLRSKKIVATFIKVVLCVHYIGIAILKCVSLCVYLFYCSKYTCVILCKILSWSFVMYLCFYISSSHSLILLIFLSKLFYESSSTGNHPKTSPEQDSNFFASQTSIPSFDYPFATNG